MDRNIFHLFLGGKRTGLGVSFLLLLELVVMSSSLLSALVLLLVICSGAAFKHCITFLCISILILGLVCIQRVTYFCSLLPYLFLKTKLQLFRPLSGLVGLPMHI